MRAEQLESGRWYWLRRADGSLAPYRFHQIVRDPTGRLVGEFFVGSFLCRFPFGAVAGEAKMPTSS